MMVQAHNNNMHPSAQATAFPYPPDLESLMIAEHKNNGRTMMSPPASPEQQNRMTDAAFLKLAKPHTTLHRILSGGSQDNQDAPYFVDKDGVEYEPYSLSWRYLGIYMDCDVDEIGVGDLYNYWDDDDNWQGGNGGGQQEKGDDDTFQWNEDDQVDIDQATDWSRRRRHLMEYDDNNTTARSRTSQQERKLEDYDDCTRKVLWAAYYDPRYKGGSIGEYQYFDFESGTYSKEHCHSRCCRRMDCHEPNTHFKLVGVYKETDGLADFAQQLFKHQGYCLWNEEKYEFMQSYADWWPSYCRQLYYSSYYGGTTLYMDLRPQPEGNITVGIYTDNTCSVPSSYTFGDYIMMYYSYYGNYDAGSQVVETWEYAIQTWNAYMQTYKVCQPCKAYNLYDQDDEEEGGNGSGDNNGRMRFLGEDNGNDDTVEEEQWGYNCYDDAGYTNCHQCNKFASQTDMAVATEQDLERADRQGSILRIKVGRKTYGKGGFRGPPKFNYLALTISGFMIMMVVAGIYTAMHRGFLQNVKGKLCTGRYRVKEWWGGNDDGGSNKVSTTSDKVISGRVKSNDRRKIEYNPPAIKHCDSRSQRDNKAASIEAKSKVTRKIEKLFHLGRHESSKINDISAPRQGSSKVDNIKLPRSLRNVPTIIDAGYEFPKRCRSLDTPNFERKTGDSVEQALGLNLSTSRSQELHSRIQEWKSTIAPVERGKSLSTSKSQELQSRIHEWKNATIT